MDVPAALLFCPPFVSALLPLPVFLPRIPLVSAPEVMFDHILQLKVTTCTLAFAHARLPPASDPVRLVFFEEKAVELVHIPAVSLFAWLGFRV